MLEVMHIVSDVALIALMVGVLVMLWSLEKVMLSVIRSNNALLAQGERTLRREVTILDALDQAEGDKHD